MSQETQFISQFALITEKDFFDPPVQKLGKIFKFVKSKSDISVDIGFHDVVLEIPYAEIMIKPHAEIDISSFWINMEIDWLGADNVLEPYTIFVRVKVSDLRFTVAFKGKFEVYSNDGSIIVKLEPRSLIHIFND